MLHLAYSSGGNVALLDERLTRLRKFRLFPEEGCFLVFDGHDGSGVRLNAEFAVVEELAGFGHLLGSETPICFVEELKRAPSTGKLDRLRLVAETVPPGRRVVFSPELKQWEEEGRELSPKKRVKNDAVSDVTIQIPTMEFFHPWSAAQKVLKKHPVITCTVRLKDCFALCFGNELQFYDLFAEGSSHTLDFTAPARGNHSRTDQDCSRL